MMKPESMQIIREETKAVAQKAFPKGNTYLTLRDELGPIFYDDNSADLYPNLGQLAVSPARLALIP